jgi:hypothetical protein
LAFDRRLICRPCLYRVTAGRAEALEVAVGCHKQIGLNGIAPDGCPVVTQVFEGNTATLAIQVEKLQHCLKLDHVVLAGDRAMITQARITTDL